MSMVVQRSSLDKVKERLAGLKRDRDTQLINSHNSQSKQTTISDIINNLD